MPSAQLVLVRHGHTSANGGEGHMRLCGWTDVPLSARGHRQAELVARRLREEPPLAAVYASPLQRAHVTAAYVAREAGGTVRLERGLREIGCGSADGLTVEEVRAELPVSWERNARQDDDDFRWPGGESYREFRERSLKAIRAIAERHAGQRVAVVTHTGVITQLLGSMAGLRPARWRAYQVGNASMTTVELTHDRARLIQLDDREHLAVMETAHTTTPRLLAG